MEIVIIDDHKIIIEGIEMLLSFEDDIKILKTYNDGFDLINDLRTAKVAPQIVLMDLMMPTINGYDCSKILKKEFPEIKIIILSMYCDAKVAYELSEKIGVEGFLSKNITTSQLVTALNDVKDGYIHLSEEAENAVRKYKNRILQYPEVELSNREKEILRLVMDAHNSREIAEKLCISESTVETHRRNIYRKTGAHSLTKLMQMVNELNLLEGL